MCTCMYVRGGPRFIRPLRCDLQDLLCLINTTKKQTPWPESASELYRLSDRSLSAKLVPTFYG
jgi:hypothetical protein